jgi:tRNA(Ile)-lysidine synthase
MLEARGDATPCVRWGPSEIHAWRGRYYLGHGTAASLAERLSRAAAPPPPWRRELPRMSGLAVLPGGSAVHLGAAGRLRLEAAREGPRLRDEPGMAFLVRGRVGGERLRLRPGTTAVHQDVRKLLQAANVPPWLRDEVPLLWTVPADALGAACAAFGAGELVAVGDWFHDAARLARGDEPGWRVVWDRPFA